MPQLLSKWGFVHVGDWTVVGGKLSWPDHPRTRQPGVYLLMDSHCDVLYVGMSDKQTVLHRWKRLRSWISKPSRGKQLSQPASAGCFVGKLALLHLRLEADAIHGYVAPPPVWKGLRFTTECFETSIQDFFAKRSPVNSTSEYARRHLTTNPRWMTRGVKKYVISTAAKAYLKQVQRLTKVSGIVTWNKTVDWLKVKEEE